MRYGTRRVVLTSLAISVVLGFLVTGHYLYKAPIGLDQTAYFGGEILYGFGRILMPEAHGSLAGVMLGVLSLLGLGAVVFHTVRRARRAELVLADPERRGFLIGAAAGSGAAVGSIVVAGAVAAGRALLGWGTSGKGWQSVSAEIASGPVVKTHPEWEKAWKGSRVRSYRRLGRTDWKVSDIVLGTGQIRGENGERIARLAIDRGVNYFDTSPDYSRAGSEQAMGRAIKGVRDKLFIATKFCTPTGHLPPGTPVTRYRSAVESSLRRLGTDYVDLVHIHSCDEVDRLLDPNLHEAFDRLKEQGKVRFLGFSTHTPRLVEVANAGIDSDRFDVMMLAYHHGIWAPLAEIIERGRKERDMGVVAMKTLKGARHHGLAGFQEESDAYSQAALKWALSSPYVSCAVISFFELQHVDEYLAASGKAPTPRDHALLRKYDELIAGTYCAPHCGACLDKCPEGLPIHDVLRQRMYFEDYGWQKEGMRLYAQLEKNASRCVGCSAPCLGSCPGDIQIQERMLGAHDLLTLS